MHFIFRKSDREHLYTAHDSPNALRDELGACVRNEGGTEDDYLIIAHDGEWLADMVPICSVKGILSFKKSPLTLQREAHATSRVTALAKLQALGLTEAEANALVTKV